MSKLDAQQVCDELNNLLNFEGFSELIRKKHEASLEVARDSDIVCSPSVMFDSGFETSALGIINALVSEPVGLCLDDNKKCVGFVLANFSKLPDSTNESFGDKE